jgi:hypothetical protein
MRSRGQVWLRSAPQSAAAATQATMKGFPRISISLTGARGATPPVAIKMSSLSQRVNKT